MTARSLVALLVLAVPLWAAEEYTYWIDPCGAQTAKASSCEPADTQLAQWAFEAWQRESKGAVTFQKAASEAHARLRLSWASGNDSLYGETRSALVDGQRGAFIYVLPAARPEKLMRDAVLYLTCVHEIGHALGLPHTASFDDIMYTFSLGGNIGEYFGRYRRLLRTRDDIRLHSGVSDADRTAVRGARNETP